MRLAGKTFALVCAALALALAPAGSAAGDRGTATRVHIQPVSGEFAFHGRVISSHRACVRRRRVHLFHDLAKPDRLVASTLSHRDGAWRIALPKRARNVGEYYYVRVGPRRGCAGAKSAYSEMG